MKKILIMLLTLIMILNFAGCGGGEEHTYVIGPKSCTMFFSNPPEDVVEFQDQSPWIGDNYVSMDVDTDGNLVLVLNDKHIEHWRTEILDKFNAMNEADAEYGLGAVFNEDYTELKYYTNENVYDTAAFGIAIIFPYCGILQMLDGGDPNEWHLDIQVIDAHTDTIVKEGRLPDDKEFGVMKEDWEKALGAAE